MGEGMVVIRCQAPSVWRYRLYDEPEKYCCEEHLELLREEVRMHNLQIAVISRLGNNDRDALIPCDMIVGVR